MQYHYTMRTRVRGMFFPKALTSIKEPRLCRPHRTLWPIAVAFICYFAPLLASAATIVPFRITEDTVWTLAESPYLVNGPFTIPAGYTLSVEPGVVIKVAGPSYAIFVSGTFDSKGTADSPVIITSFQDDTVGGDTNGDGAASTPAPGDWAQIRVGNTGMFRAKYTEVRYGGSTAFRTPGSSAYPLIWNAGGILSISNTILSESADRGVYQEYGTALVSESTIRDNAGIGYEHAGGLSRIENSVFSGQSDTALFGRETGTLEVTQSLFRRNERAIALDLFKALSFIHSGNTISESPRAAIELSGNVTGSHRFTNEGIPYLLTSVLHIMPEAQLTLDPGVVIKMEQIISFLQVSGTLQVLGTADAPITITSFQDDTAGGDTNGDGAASTPAPGDWQYLRTRDSGVIRAEHLRVLYGGNTLSGGLGASLIWASGSELSLSDATLSESGSRGVYQEVGATTISKSIIRDNAGIGYEHRGGVSTIGESVLLSGAASFAVYNPTFDMVDARGNWWGSETGPTHPSNPLGTGSRVSDRVLFTPWLSSDPLAEPACCSSVAFIPGIKGSRLYKMVDGDENRLWEPNRNADVDKLFMNPDGTSVDPDIYTQDIVDSAFGIVAIYDSFIEFMDGLVSDGTIAGWRALPYDWRLAPNEVVLKGVETEGGNISYLAPVPDGELPLMIKKISELAASSKNGKVTIVTHSNGGLVAKSLLARLEVLKSLGESDLLDKIDRVIMVAAPQLGTPSALGSMLHGDDEDMWGGIILNKQRARLFAENLPAAYTLLPSTKFFDTVSDPIVTFSEDIENAANFGAYAPDISSFAELGQFFLAILDGRSHPTFYDTATPNVLNPALLAAAESFHTSADTYEFPPSIAVTEIAGWGLDTMKGIHYDATRPCPIFCDYKLSRESIKTVEGDGVVVYPSAIDSSGAGYFFNLFDYNENNAILFFGNKKHANLFTATSIQEFVRNLITDSNVLPNYLTDIKPVLDAEGERLTLSVHSPITIDAYDSTNLHTGLIPNPIPDSDLTFFEEQIPNSYYEEFGEGKTVGLDSDDTYRIVMNGTGYGTFTFEKEERFADGSATTTVFTDLPVTPITVAEVDIVPEATTTVVKLDTDGDGDFDYALEPSDEFDPILFLESLKSFVVSLDLPPKIEKFIIKKIDKVLKDIEKGKIKNAEKKIKTAIKIFSHKKGHLKKIPDEDLNAIITMLNQLLDNLK